MARVIVDPLVTHPATDWEAEYLAAKAAYEAARDRLRRARAAFYLSGRKKSATRVRDRVIHDRYRAGEDITALASEFGLAVSSASNIVRRVGQALGEPVTIQTGTARQHRIHGANQATRRQILR